MADVTDPMASLALDDSEEEVLQVDDESVPSRPSLDLYLVGSFLTTSVVKFDAIEGLSSLLRSAVQSRTLSGAKISRSAPVMSHLLFTDDCLIFGAATAREAAAVKSVLHKYASYFGQLINFDKFGLFFSTNMLEDTRGDVRRILGISSSTSL
ncbi:hypothetical protein V6N13_060211 [Hibiscus sabdariffa]